MKLATIDREIETSAGLVHQSFKIGDSSKMFALLADKIYSDKPRAVVREIACNALDAHSSIGQTRPFLISAPSALEPSFSVRDYGPGLSHDDVMGLYTTFFDSSKSQSNDQVGGFGLGSKSPFSYTDAFTVTSWHEGIQSVYACFRGDDNIPQVTRATSSPSDEPAGLEVKVPVKREDYEAFKERCEKVLRWFPEGSFTPFGFKVEPVVTTMRTPKWLLRPEGGSNKWDAIKRTYVTIGHEVLMGPVSYALDWSQVPGAELPSSVVPIFQVGELDLPPSREALSYDPQTIRILKERHDLIVTELADLAHQQIKTMGAYDRLRFVSRLKTAQLGDLFKAYQIKAGTWGPTSYGPKDGYGSYFRKELEMLVIAVPFRRYERSYRTNNLNMKYKSGLSLGYTEIGHVNATTFVFHDLPDDRAPRLAERLNQVTFQNSLVLLYPSTKTPDLDTFRKCIPDAPDNLFLNLSSIPVEAKVKGVKTAANLRIYVFGANSQYGYQEDKLVSDGVYVDFTGTNPDGHNQQLLNLKWHDTPVLGLSKTARARLNMSFFETLESVLVAKAEVLLKSKEFIRAMDAYQLSRMITREDDYVVKQLCKRVGNGAPYQILTKAARGYSSDLAAAVTQHVDILAVEKLVQLGLVKRAAFVDRYDIAGLLNTLREDNPLLAFVLSGASLSFTGIHDSHLKELISNGHPVSHQDPRLDHGDRGGQATHGYV